MSSVSPIDPTSPQTDRIGRVSTVAQGTDGPAQPAPDIFRAAVESLSGTAVRAEVRVEPLRPPQKLAPYSYAISAEVVDAEGLDLASGRLVLLHDPDGHEAWDGVLRLVAYASAELDEQMGVDPMLPSVGWSWLTGALDERRAAYRAAGGHGHPDHLDPLRRPRRPADHGRHGAAASWTADTADLAPHLRAFVDLLCTAAGLPPEGVTILSAT